MNEITCGICRDLLPLVRDGIAGEESRTAVEQHLSSCKACRALLAGEQPPAPQEEAAFRRLRRRLALLQAPLLLFGLFFGLGLTGGSGIFYNTVLMPIIGALAYGVFRWRALWIAPALLLAGQGLLNLVSLARGAEHLLLPDLLLWTGLYSLFAAVGTLIAGLLHYALKKEELHE